MPPQGRADYTFLQHIIKSLNPIKGRCAILFPHGVLFRDEEHDMRRKLVESDLIECIIGLGPNLFYNSPMEACVIVCRMQKTSDRKRKILFINAVREVTREKAQSFLREEHIRKILNCYRNFRDEEGFAKVVPMDLVLTNDGNLSIPLYVNSEGNNIESKSLGQLFVDWSQSSDKQKKAIDSLFSVLVEATSQ